eukprot:m.313178 g.313178  ORF g.313178 m.313178 type:complete len:496 (+) comp20254_c0_seq1:102-1589(+)
MLHPLRNPRHDHAVNRCLVEHVNNKLLFYVPIGCLLAVCVAADTMADTMTDTMAAEDTQGRLVLDVARLGILVWLIIVLYRIVFNSRTKKSLMITSTLLVAGAVMISSILPPMIEKSLNRVQFPRPSDALIKWPTLMPAAVDLHARLLVADTHSDSLLWFRRDLLRKSDIGHVDIPRLLEGGVAFQAFTIVTGSPSGLRFDFNAEPSLLTDTITQKALLENWGLDAVTTRTGRVFAQTRRMHDIAARSQGALQVLLTRSDVQGFVAQRRAGQRAVGAIIGIEGLHCLDGDAANIDRFFADGVRMAGLTHFFDNDLGGSAHGIAKGGLSTFGAAILARMEELNMIVDVAHASAALVDDIIARATRPLLSSHTGVRGVCDNDRNLHDHHLDAIAKSGGLISIAYFRPAVCAGSEGEPASPQTFVDSIVRSIMYVVRRVGVDHVSLGSDFDGTVAVPFDTTQLVYLTNALLQQDLSEEDVAKIMGENVLRFMARVLPA